MLLEHQTFPNQNSAIDICETAAGIHGTDDNAQRSDTAVHRGDGHGGQSSGSRTYPPQPLNPCPLNAYRAAIVSACTYREEWDCKDYLEEHRHTLKLNKVMFATQKCQISMALMEDKTLFVAFPGSKTIMDWLLNLDTRHHRFVKDEIGFLGDGVPGLYHTGFMQRLKEMLPDMLRLDAYMLEEEIKQLVFCGHSLGGSVAHLALIKFVMTLPNHALSYNPISIGLGSPHFCDQEANWFLEDQSSLHGGLSGRMFTYINKDDAVPHLLKNTDHTKKKALQYFLQEKIPNWLNPSKWCWNSQHASQLSTLMSERGAADREIGCSSFCVAFWTMIQGAEQAPVYVRVGQDINVEPIASESELNITEHSIQSHSVGAYALVLQKSYQKEQKSYQKEQPAEVTRHAGSSSSMAVTSMLAPSIRRCSMAFEGRHDEPKRAKIVVFGEHLAFYKKHKLVFRGSKALHGQQHYSSRMWRLEICNNNKLVLNCEDDEMTAFLTSRNRDDSVMFSLSISTWFGKFEEQQVQVGYPWFDSCMQCMVSCSLSKLHLLSKCRLLDTTEARDLVSQNLLCDLVSGYYGSHDQLDLGLVFQSAWDGNLTPWLEQLFKAVPSAQAASGSRFSFCDNGHEQTTTNYYDCLNELVSQMHVNIVDRENGQQLPPKANIGVRLSLLENKIHALCLEASNSQEGLSKIIDPMLRKKGEKIYSIISAHKFLCGLAKTVIFVGPRYAGKSTLINCLIGDEVAGGKAREETEEKERERAASLPRAAPAQARVDAFRYRMKLKRNDLEVEEEVILVEIPGVLGCEQGWKHLAHVADLVVVVVPFPGDTAEAAREAAEGARKKGLCSNIVVVVNGVDKILHGTRDSNVWTKYSFDALESDHHARYAKRADVPADSLFFTVALEEAKLEYDTMKELRERAIMFGPDIAQVLRERISKLPHHDHKKTSAIRNQPNRFKH